MQAFHSMSAIFPVGYEASRIYWSMRHGNRRCHYVCSIDEKDSEPEFIIRVVEQGYDDLVLTGSSSKGKQLHLMAFTLLTSSGFFPPEMYDTDLDASV